MVYYEMHFARLDSESDHDGSPDGVNADPNNPSVQDDVVEGLETSGDHGEPDSIEGDADPALARLGRTNSRSASFVVRLH